MTKRWMVCLCGLLALSFAPGAQAETIRGYFEGIIGGHNAGSGAPGMTGWAVADSGVRKVVIQVDGVDLGQAGYGGVRPDVTSAVPGFPDSPAPGFGYFLNTTDFENGVHTVSAKVYTWDGNEAVIDGTRQIFFNNNTSILAPFGAINWPHRNADLYGTCDLTAPSRTYTPVIGWVLDLGVEIGDQGVGYVELLLDGSIVYNSDTSCSYILETGGFTNCYGLPRLDVESMFPFSLNASSTGYRFVLDIGALISFGGWAQGNHTLTVRAGDISNQVANVAEIPVFFHCEENLPNQGSFGVIESPVESRPYEDTIVFQGWALDAQGILRVDIYVDGQFVGTADYGVDSRPAVLMQYPGFINAEAPVWRFEYDSYQTSNGSHQIQVYAVDIGAGVGTLIGERTFFVDNGPN
jgi:hypothetical protein